MSPKRDLSLTKILNALKQKRNVDFSLYRESVLMRRVMTRVRSTKHKNFEDYHDYLKQNPEEMTLLMEAMTINVTEFFRDPYVFSAFEYNVIPDLFSRKEKAGLSRVRIWSCASSSGEEAYSILMLIAKYLGEELDHFNISIVGTDIDQGSLERASLGVYPELEFSKLLSDEMKLIDIFFQHSERDKCYVIKNEWKDFVSFKYHDITSDPTFGKMDVIFCRNLLIYLDRELQVKIIGKLYNALNNGGFLILGNVESLWGEFRDKFSEFDRKARIYIKK